MPVAHPLQILAAFAGFAQASSDPLTLAARQGATVHLRMMLPSVRAEVIVTGAAGEIRTDEPQLGDRITGEQARATPLLNRRVTYLPLLNAANRPAINQGDVFMNQELFTANGTGRRRTRWTPSMPMCPARIRMILAAAAAPLNWAMPSTISAIVWC